MRIGWIGLGAIGRQMVLRLLAAGHAVTVHARGTGLAEVRAAGAEAESDYSALAAGADLLVVCVFTDTQVGEVLLDHGALAAMRPGSVVAIHTTGSPALVQRLAVAAPDGVEVLDATFSGGPAEVAAGTLTMMVGGEQGALARATPAFTAYAGTVHHVGGVGQGQTLKLLNNLLFASNLIQAAAALELGAAHGLDSGVAAPIIQACSGASFAMARLGGPRSPREALAAVRPYLAKDVANAAASAAEAGLDVTAFAATIAFFAPAGEKADG